MQSSYWGYWLIILGVAIVGLSISVQGMTTSSTQDYYSIKEITDASMLESVDYGYYRDYNEVKINKEKFIEVFTRMLVETMGANDTYEVNFYEIYEAPPKVSVEVKSNSGANFTSANYDTISKIDAIIQIHAEQVKGNGSVNNNVNEDEDEDQNNTSSGTNVTDVKITNKDVVKNVKVDSTFTLNVSSPSSSTCTWSSNNTDVATVDSKGNVKILNIGVATVTVNCANKSDSVEIIVEDGNNGDCSVELVSFEVEGVTNNKFELGKTYNAKLVFVVRPPQGESGVCELNRSGIGISEPIGLNESTNLYNSSFDGYEKPIDVEITDGDEAEAEIEMKFKVPDDFKGQEIKLSAWVDNSSEKQITLRR